MTKGEIKTKTCFRCHKELPISAFGLNGIRKGKIYYRGSCKECMAIGKDRWVAIKQKRLDDGILRCSKCKQNKTLQCFYKDLSKPKGYNSWCKSCMRVCLDNIAEDIKVKTKERYLSLPKSYIKKLTDRYRQKYPARARAVNILYRARKSGNIKPSPCEVCGVGKVEGHHEDYSKPLQVRWLCRKHHKMVHRKTDPLILPNLKEKDLA